MPSPNKQTLNNIAAIQMASGLQVEPNLIEATKLIREAAEQGAQMAVLPESLALMAKYESENIEIAEEFGKGIIQDTLKQCAIDNQIWIVAGSIPLKCDNSEKVYTSSLMINAEGDIVARYNKIHLFDVDINAGTDSKSETYRESDTFIAGDEVVVVDTPFGKIGMSICYDLRFPMLYQEMVKRGAEIILVPSAFTYATGKMHWETLLRARAIENQCYVIAPSQSDHHANGRHTYGNTIAIDYLGKVQGLLLKGPGSITISIDLEAQGKLRDSFPVLKHSKMQ